MIRRLPLLIALLGAACADQATRRGDTVIFASGAELQGMNPLVTTHPLARQVQRYLLLTTLVQRDGAGAIVPYLARQWQWSADSLLLTMRISTALRWHDGIPTTARDVAWTFNAARDPVTGYPRASELADVDTVFAQDDSTIRFSFSAPPGHVPDVFTDLAILPEHSWRGVTHAAIRQGQWNTTPIGNGPFRFLSHATNRRWVFAANPDFPVELGGPPHLQRIVIAVVDEPTTKLAALTSGELDFAGIQPAHASFVRHDPQLTVISYPLRFTYVILYNTRVAPFNDLAVRKAMALVLDRRTIVDGYLFGFGTPASGPSPTDTTNTETSSRDVAAARELLAAQHLSFELLTVGSGEAALEQMIQSQLRAAGVQMTIRQLELTSFLDRVHGSSHEFTAAVMGVSGNPDFGEIAPMLGDAGAAVPRSITAQQASLRDSAVVTFLYHARGVQGANRRVRGVHMDLRGELATSHDWTIAP